MSHHTEFNFVIPVPDDVHEPAHDLPILRLASFMYGYRKVMRVRSRECTMFIDRQAFKSTGRPLKQNSRKELLDLLQATAQFDGPTIDVFVRTAFINSKIIYHINPGSVSITKSGVSFEDDPAVKFCGYGVQRPQVSPNLAATEKDLMKVFDYVNINNRNDQLLFICFLVTCLLEHIQHPILVLTGEKGAAKTSALKFILTVIDPSSTIDMAFSNEDEFLRAAAHRYIIPIDNAGSLTENKSNLLCKFVTGAGYMKRELYTDDEDIFKQYRRTIVINGINLPMWKPDVLDRSLIINLEKIDEKNRKSEAELSLALAKDLPSILGGLFVVASDMLRHKEIVSHKNLARMSDFTIWGRAAALSIGESEEVFDQALREKNEERQYEALEASDVGTAIVWVLENKLPFISGSPAEVLDILRHHLPNIQVNQRTFPSNPRAFGRRLEEIKPVLEQLGIPVRRSRGKDRRIEIGVPGAEKQ